MKENPILPDIADSKILIVDDEPSLRMLLREIVSPLGCQVTEAADGLEGLEALKREPFDLALIDIKMPRMSGLELVEKMEEVSPQTVKIIVTAYANTKHLMAAFKYNVTDFMPKPFEEPILVVERIRKALMFKKNNDLLFALARKVLMDRKPDMDWNEFDALSNEERYRILKGVADICNLKNSAHD